MGRRPISSSRSLIHFMAHSLGRQAVGWLGPTDDVRMPIMTAPYVIRGAGVGRGRPSACSKSEIIHNPDATFSRPAAFFVTKGRCMPELEIGDLLKETRNMRPLARRIRPLAQALTAHKERLERSSEPP